MIRLRDASIRVKILLSPLMLALAMTGLAVMAILTLTEQRHMAAETRDVVFQRIALIDEFALTGERVHSDIYRIPMLRFMSLPEKEIAAAHQHLRQGLSDLDVIFGRMSTRWPLDPDEEEIVKHLKPALTAFTHQSLQAVEVVRDNPAFGILLVRSAMTSFDSFQLVLSEFLEYQRHKISLVDASAARKVQRFTRFMMILLVLVMIPAVGLSLLMSTWLISRPLLAMTFVMHRLARGDLEVAVPETDRRDEIGLMAEALTVFRRDAVEKRRLTDEIRRQNQRLEEAVQEKQREMEELFERLLRQEKLATIGRVSASIAHELRNPLGAVRQSVFFLDRLRRRNAVNGETDKLERHLTLMERELTAADRVISDLLDLSRLTPAVGMAVDIVAVAEDAIGYCQRPPDIFPRTDFPERPFVVWADPAQLRQVLINLITNAFQAVGESGEVVLSARRTDDGGAIVAVGDTGPGIPEHLLPKIFDPLFTTKAQGTGLGLSICHQIAEAHGGTIAAANRPGGGAVITLYLPGRPPDRAADPASVTASPDARPDVSPEMEVYDDPRP